MKFLDDVSEHTQMVSLLKSLIGVVVPEPEKISVKITGESAIKLVEIDCGKNNANYETLFPRNGKSIGRTILLTLRQELKDASFRYRFEFINPNQPR